MKDDDVRDLVLRCVDLWGCEPECLIGRTVDDVLTEAAAEPFVTVYWGCWTDEALRTVIEARHALPVCAGDRRWPRFGEDWR